MSVTMHSNTNYKSKYDNGNDSSYNIFSSFVDAVKNIKEQTNANIGHGDITKKEKTSAGNNVSLVPSKGPTISHPLRSAWTLWYLDKSIRATTWEAMQSEIASFETIEEFWHVYTFKCQPSSLEVGCNFSVFKKGIRPLIEDRGNCNGGRWILYFNCWAMAELDLCFKEIVLHVIGELFKEFDDVNGVIVSVREHFNKICIWNKSGSQEEIVLAIGARLKDVLNLPDIITAFELHTSTVTNMSKVPKLSYIL